MRPAWWGQHTLVGCHCPVILYALKYVLLTEPEMPVCACSYPSLLAFCGGDEDNVVRFSGQMKAGPIRKFLEQFADGKKCRQSKWALTGLFRLLMAALPLSCHMPA